MSSRPLSRARGVGGAVGRLVARCREPRTKSGFLPTKVLKPRTAARGVFSGPQNLASVEWCSRKSDCHQELGIQAARQTEMPSRP